MIIPKVKDVAHPVRMDYEIGYDAYNEYTGEDCDTETW